MPSDSTIPLQLENFLPYRLNVLAARISKTLARRYEQTYDLTIPEWRVMATLGQFGMRTAKDIAAHSEMDKIKVSRAVQRLAHKNWIEKSPNKDDRRETYLKLSNAGERTYREIVPQALGYEDTLLADLSNEERVVLDRIINHFMARAEEL